jgi:hypothetical protein
VQGVPLAVVSVVEDADAAPLPVLARASTDEEVDVAVHFGGRVALVERLVPVLQLPAGLLLRATDLRAEAFGLTSGEERVDPMGCQPAAGASGSWTLRTAATGSPTGSRTTVVPGSGT